MDFESSYFDLLDTVSYYTIEGGNLAGDISPRKVLKDEDELRLQGHVEKILRDKDAVDDRGLSLHSFLKKIFSIFLINLDGPVRPVAGLSDICNRP